MALALNAFESPWANSRTQGFKILHEDAYVLPKKTFSNCFSCFNHVLSRVLLISTWFSSCNAGVNWTDAIKVCPSVSVKIFRWVSYPTDEKMISVAPTGAFRRTKFPTSFDVVPREVLLIKICAKGIGWPVWLSDKVPVILEVWANRLVQLNSKQPQYSW